MQILPILLDAEIERIGREKFPADDTDPSYHYWSVTRAISDFVRAQAALSNNFSDARNNLSRHKFSRNRQVVDPKRMAQSSMAADIGDAVEQRTMDKGAEHRCERRAEGCLAINGTQTSEQTGNILEQPEFVYKPAIH